MSTTLTIRNLAEPIKQKLRVQAALHGRSMEAEAREILTNGVLGVTLPPPQSAEEMRERLLAVTGIWQGHGNTAEMMRELRGED